MTAWPAAGQQFARRQIGDGQHLAGVAGHFQQRPVDGAGQARFRAPRLGPGERCSRLLHVAYLKCRLATQRPLLGCSCPGRRQSLQHFQRLDLERCLTRTTLGGSGRGRRTDAIEQFVEKRGMGTLLTVSQPLSVSGR
jgi:hypothetical protein